MLVRGKLPRMKSSPLVVVQQCRCLFKVERLHTLAHSATNANKRDLVRGPGLERNAWCVFGLNDYSNLKGFFALLMFKTF